MEVLSPELPAEPEPPPLPSPDRPLGLLAGIGAMVLVPVMVLAVVLVYVPRLRPWYPDVPPVPAPTSSQETPPPEGKVLLSGRVVDGEGEPVEGARVVVYSDSRVQRVGEQATTRHGVYRFELDPGRLVLVAEHDDKGMVASAELLLDQGAVVRNLVLALGPVRTVLGKVTDEDGSPVVGAVLRVEGVPWLQRESTSETDGSYKILRMPSQEASLRVIAPGYQTTSVKLLARGLTGEEVVNLRMARESDVEGLVLDPDGLPIRAGVIACDGKEVGQRLISAADGTFKLAREFSRCPLVAYHDQHASSEPMLAEGGAVRLRLREGGSIEGLVVEESGRAVPSFYVGIESFVPAFGDRLSLRFPEPRFFQNTGGSFSLERLAPGSYVLSVGAEGRSLVRSPSVEVRGRQVTRGVRIVLPQGGSVEGLVFDEEKRTPLAASKISFDSTSSLAHPDLSHTTSDEAGRFRLEGAPAGPFTLRVEHEGYRTRLLAGLRVGSGEVLKQEIGLKRSGEGGGGLDFVGIGALMEQTREGLRFREVFPGSPAEKAGLKAGDWLRRIDGQGVEGMSLADAIQRLRGEKGSRVSVTVERPPAGDSVDTTITRDEIVR
ncbi:MAG: carboxypeptidase regulatory-like domain-containing protein [Myxococcales bacterium]|nr:carboxypeptidase regulatory-like domain-containing protein [Polyangiaceae bacterium]MDW8249601.1 carboxypeptidase regulatory-like domain-containing protein [Myxococcales bacterium]